MMMFMVIWGCIRISQFFGGYWQIQANVCKPFQPQKPIFWGDPTSAANKFTVVLKKPKQAICIFQDEFANL